MLRLRPHKLSGLVPRSVHGDDLESVICGHQKERDRTSSSFSAPSTDRGRLPAAAENLIQVYKPWKLKNSSLFSFSIAACQRDRAQCAATAVIRNSDVNSAPPPLTPSPAALLTGRHGNWHKSHFPENLWTAFGTERRERTKKKVNSCICCTSCENASFIWCQRAGAALSSVQI